MYQNTSSIISTKMFETTNRTASFIRVTYAAQCAKRITDIKDKKQTQYKRTTYSNKTRNNYLHYFSHVRATYETYILYTTLTESTEKKSCLFSRQARNRMNQLNTPINVSVYNLNVTLVGTNLLFFYTYNKS